TDVRKRGSERPSPDLRHSVFYSPGFQFSCAGNRQHSGTCVFVCVGRKTPTPAGNRPGLESAVFLIGGENTDQRSNSSTVPERGSWERSTKSPSGLWGVKMGNFWTSTGRPLLLPLACDVVTLFEVRPEFVPSLKLDLRQAVRARKL